MVSSSHEDLDIFAFLVALLEFGGRGEDERKAPASSQNEAKKANEGDGAAPKRPGGGETGELVVFWEQVGSV